jgi:hypothetical protein
VSVYRARENMGRRLAVEHPVPADVVIPVPDSGRAAAIGYARESGIPFGEGLMRSHYIGRTFIEPSQQIRSFGVKLKLSPVREVLVGRRVVVIDDSIVRGTTSRKIIGMIRAAGAKEIHVRISSPPTVGPCHYGIDTPRRDELIASSHSTEQIRAFIGADSLAYLSLDGLYTALSKTPPAEGGGGPVRRLLLEPVPHQRGPAGAPAPAAADLGVDAGPAWPPARRRSRSSTAARRRARRSTPPSPAQRRLFPRASSIATWTGSPPSASASCSPRGGRDRRRAPRRRRLDLVRRRPAR